MRRGEGGAEGVRASRHMPNTNSSLVGGCQGTGTCSVGQTWATVAEGARVHLGPSSDSELVERSECGLLR